MSRMVYLGLIMLLSTLVLPMATTAQGNSEAAHACQNWQTLQTDEGVGFANKGECVSYAAQGGTLEARNVATITDVFVFVE